MKYTTTAIASLAALLATVSAAYGPLTSTVIVDITSTITTIINPSTALLPRADEPRTSTITVDITRTITTTIYPSTTLLPRAYEPPTKTITIDITSTITTTVILPPTTLLPRADPTTLSTVYTTKTTTRHTTNTHTTTMAPDQQHGQTMSELKGTVVIDDSSTTDAALASAREYMSTYTSSPATSAAATAGIRARHGGGEGPAVHQSGPDHGEGDDWNGIPFELPLPHTHTRTHTHTTGGERGKAVLLPSTRTRTVVPVMTTGLGDGV
ncbi:hypothetical protein EG328_000640 [Venturia inaequalis]|uniref:Uncharacterized protein n=1 Tax=Venturia inaequalis TaxID=5025 RepID=A0A8H3V2J5_VENIN|nr:hypothetical protein EG328_000640 [Venturia inaequalis]